jgi:hypothetical protein
MQYRRAIRLRLIPGRLGQAVLSKMPLASGGCFIQALPEKMAATFKLSGLQPLPIF